MRFNAWFLHEHPGWSPRDLADADPELVDLMWHIANDQPARKTTFDRST